MTRFGCRPGATTSYIAARPPAPTIMAVQHRPVCVPHVKTMVQIPRWPQFFAVPTLDIFLPRRRVRIQSKKTSPAASFHRLQSTKMMPDIRRLSWMSIREPEPEPLSDPESEIDEKQPAARPEFSALLHGSSPEHRDRLVRLLQLHTSSAPSAEEIRSFAAGAAARKLQVCNQTCRDSLLDTSEFVLSEEALLSEEADDDELPQETPEITAAEEYFLAALPRFGSADYEPIPDDILALPLPHTGVACYPIPLPDQTLRLVDTTSLTHMPSNSKKLSRMGMFSDLDGMFYLVSLASYNADLKEVRAKRTCAQSAVFVLDMEGFSAKSVAGYEGDDAREAARFVGELFVEAVEEKYGQNEKQNKKACYVLVPEIMEGCREELERGLGECLAEIIKAKGSYLKA
jgi:hypothetical protein